ncbi:DNA polymerase III subunit alpha, partial [Rhizobiaceae sp. 2RAB30]
AGMRKALIGMRPDRIEDIIALVALYRPGPMENIPTYNARKHGEEEIESIHPKIDHLVKETQGVIVYQEQVMQIAQELSGYSLGEADLLRRAMGKKIRAEMDKQRERFVSGAVERGVGKAQSNFIFDLLAKFADYGFNKSHAAAYAIVSYQTAYLKAHYPVEFLAASMTLDMSNTEKLSDFRQDAMRLGIDVVPPSVMTSYRPFEVGENRIFYSLAAIKGVGDAAVEHIVAKRAEKPFASLADLCERLDPKVVGKRVFESLIAAGALDCFGHDRATLMGGVERMMGMAQRAQQNAVSGQADIFGAAISGEAPTLHLPHSDPWLPAERLHREFQAVGFYLSAHPLDEYKTALQKMRVQNWA